MALTKKQMIKLYTNLVRCRRFDESWVKLFAEGKMYGFYHSGQGEEAITAGSCTFLRQDDYIYPHVRSCGLYHTMCKGADPKYFLAEYYGKATGCCCGLSSFHPAAPEFGILGHTGTLGPQFVISAGWALGAKKKGKGQVVVCFFGDGSSNRGQLHEAFNLAALWKLPVVWVCENNGIAVFQPTKDSCPREDIADLAAGYNMPGVVVDGQDVVAVYEATQVAVDRARAGEGPSLIECKTYRYRSHGEGMPDFIHAEPRPKEEIEAWKKRDPVKLFQEKLLTESILTKADIERIDHEVIVEVEGAVRFAEESPPPDPSILKKVLYAD